MTVPAPTLVAPSGRAPGWTRLAWTYGPLAACLGLVTALSCTRLQFASLPYSGVSRHVLAFSILTLLFCRALTASPRPWIKRHFAVLTVTAASLFGALDEFHHLFVRGRDADVVDWLVDTLAAVGSMSVLLAVRHWARHRRPDGTRPIVVPAAVPFPPPVASSRHFQ